MFRKIKKTMIILFITLIVLSLGGYLFMQQPQFGRNPSGKSLERIQKSPHYQNGAFKNQHFTPDLAEAYRDWET